LAASKTLLLFDIDGTILSTNGAGKKAFAMGLREAHGLDDPLVDVSFDGATDWEVYDRIMAKHEIAPSEKSRERFFAAMGRALQTTLADGAPFVYPGAADSIHMLAGRLDVQLGLVTGNAEACARLKLGHFDLDRHFPFGGFGSDHAERVEMARIAVGRAEIHRPAGVEYGSRVLIGDTPADIQAAHSIGALAVAVTTGGLAEDELHTAGADVVARNIPSAIARVPGLNL
jgi:phosphoglycolate phosphatase-like HAD superfamily hydrolase